MASSPSENQITGYVPSPQGEFVSLIGFVCAPVLIFVTSLEYALPIVIGTVTLIISGKAVYGHHLKFDPSLRQVEVIPAWFYFIKSDAVRRYDFHEILYIGIRHTADSDNLVEVAFRDRKTYGLYPGNTLKYYDSLCRMVGCEKLELGQWEKVVDH